MSEFNLPDRVVLVGPSGSGKSELAARLAARIGYTPVDTDALIEERIEMPVFEFFATFGEAAFRAIEHEVLKQVCERTGVVIASGGGVVTVEDNWTAMRPGSVIVCLRAKPETLVARVDAQASGGDASAVRPLLAGNALERLREQLTLRNPLYDRADIVVHTDSLTPDEVSDEVWRRLTEGRGIAVPAFSLPGIVDRSDIYVERGVAAAAGELVARRWPKSSHAWIISDENVAPAWAEQVAGWLSSGGLTSELLSVPAGESSKSFAMVEQLCNQITSRRANRRDVVVALGGGVVGDLAGLVASVCLRGLPLVQMPTSLLAMVDSSVGGKTGINTPSGKNQVGTFNQPALVFVDSTFLSTLPDEEYRSGMAEVIKHSIIQPGTPFGGSTLGQVLEAQPRLSPLPHGQIDEILRLNVGIKHSVVQADERESGLRMVLNFGHTTGHAIEADGYRYRHGEAVGLGMLVASRMALELERVDRAWVDRLHGLIDLAGLPVRIEGQVDDIIERLAHDKKNVAGTLHWVLPAGDGGCDIVTGIDLDLVRRALKDLGAT